MHIAQSILQYLKEIISLELLYKRDIAHFMESYKPYCIVESINSNYIGDFKD